MLRNCFENDRYGINSVYDKKNLAVLNDSRRSKSQISPDDLVQSLSLHLIGHRRCSNNA